ncbi:MAG: hypothetical protein ACOYXB_03805 [Bacteroidota bacterium]
MNRFARIQVLNDFYFRKVKYYSICIEESENTEFEDFLTRMESEPEYEEDVINLFSWLELIGEYEGAKEKYFRHEGLISDTKALPPPASQMDDNGLNVRDLRLYCQRLNEHVVILFNGGIKTKNKAQDCPNVSGYFRQANKFSKQINELFAQKEIKWNSNHTDIIFDSDLILEL